MSESTTVRHVIEVNESERGRAYKGPVIDCDVHHTWSSQSALLPYMSKGWREYVEGPPDGQIPVTANLDFVNPHGGMRADAKPAEGGKPGADFPTLKAQLLDRFNVRRALLTHGEGLFGINRLRNPYFAQEVARAANDWTVENWLEKDERLAGSVLVANHLPEEAAKEVRRVGGHPQMAQVIMTGNGIGQPLGHPLFHPIYEAALEMGLPVALHGGGAGYAYQPAAGGFINLYLEYHTLMIQPVMTQVVSLIAHGVFEKYPELKVLLVEGGVAWVPALMWRMDADYKGLRRETPWLKRLPSEYFQEHIRLTTQPLELSPKRDQLIELLRTFDGDRMLLFATDYPHWDTDDVDYIATRLPREWLPRIYYENALEFYGWDPEIITEARTA